MLPRLQAEDSQRLLSVALATNGREMSDQERTAYLGDLDEATAVATPRRRAPKVTLAFMRNLTAAASRQQ